MKKVVALAACVVLVGFTITRATAPAYDTAADAKSRIQQALSAAKATNARVLVIFGANWCEDCRALDRALQAPKNAALLAREFIVVKVDVGNFDRNIDIAKRYGDPVAKGIPAAVVLSPAGEVLYATHAGELANARRMSDTGVLKFLWHEATSEP